MKKYITQSQARTTFFTKLLSLLCIPFLIASCSTTVTISSNYNGTEKVDLLAIGPKKSKEIKGVNLPYKYKIKDNNVPQLLILSSETRVYDPIWIEAGSRNINENLYPPAIMFAVLTLGAATPILHYMSADIPSQKIYIIPSEPSDSTNLYKQNDTYLEFMLTSKVYELLSSDYNEHFIYSPDKTTIVRINDNPKRAQSLTNYLITKSPSAETYYLRGVSYKNLHDIKKALKDFNKAYSLINSQTASWLVDEISNNIIKLESTQQQLAAERRQRFTEALFEIGRVAANTYVQMQNPSFSTQGNIYNSELLNPQLAISQVQDQIYNEYIHFTEHNKKFDGSNYSFNEWWALKGEAINNVNSNNTNYNQSQYESGYNSNSSTGYQKDCHLCHGTGKCNTCNGKHYYINPLTGKYITCPNCKPDGLCSACGGTGKKQ